VQPCKGVPAGNLKTYEFFVYLSFSVIIFTSKAFEGKGKSKVHPRTGHKGSEGE
jgi:hypothetical protein